MRTVPSKFISGDGKILWLAYSANFSSGWNGVKLEFKPPGGTYGLSLHEIRLLDRANSDRSLRLLNSADVYSAGSHTRFISAQPSGSWIVSSARTKG